MRVHLAGPPFAEEHRRPEGHEQEIVEGDLADIGSCDAVLAASTAPDEGTASLVRTPLRPE